VSKRQARARPTNCYDLMTKFGKRNSGVHTVFIYHEHNGIYKDVSIDVFCDMKTDAGGWTVCVNT